MNIYTIGFTKKSARKFFTLLKDNNINLLMDIRLNNSSQLAGFAKGKDLEFFLSEFLNIRYIHELSLAPTEKLLDEYKKGMISWQLYEEEYYKILEERNIKNTLDEKYNRNFDKVCLLCSEHTADQCHRRLAAEYIKKVCPELDINITHL
jgi:uncharacterized protein (DUF488 family)